MNQKEKTIGFRRIGFACVLVGIACIANTVSAEIFKHVDKHGNVTYSDQEEKDSKKVDLGPINSQPFPKGKAPTVTKKKSIDGYTGITISSPTNNATIPPGQLTVPVKFTTTPKLHPAHRAQVFLDGVPQGSPSNTSSLSVSNLYRGEHSIKVSISNKKGRVLIVSNPVLIHVKRPVSN